MHISYKILFKVELKHTYYADGVCKDFEIHPTSETVKWLNENNMIFKRDEIGFRVYYRNAKNPSLNEPFTAFDATQLRFMLFLKNPEKFFNVTDLTFGTASYSSGELLAMKNAGTAESLLFSFINELRPTVFSYNFPQLAASSSDVGKIEVFNAQNQNVTPTSPDPNAISPDVNNVFSYPLDFSELPVGEYSITTKVNNANAQERKIYVDNRVMATKPFGMVLIDLPASTSSFNSNTQYAVQLDRKIGKWKYFFVMNSLSSTDTYTVIDTADPPFTFDEEADTEINGIPTLVFKSDQTIPVSEIPLSTLQLKKSANVVINGLPNPAVNVISSSPDDAEVYEIYVNV